MSTLDFGEPVLNSTITQIEHGTLFYCGHDAVELSRKATLEEIASLLWQCPTLPAPLTSELAEASAFDVPGADPRGPGGASGAVCSILDDSDFMDHPARGIAARRGCGANVPGFGHRLYSKGDPRADAILARIALPAEVEQLIRAMETATGQKPGFDLALVVLERVLKLPRGAAFTMLATGRVVGWIAHVFEQWGEDQMIRPRAAYGGA